jgi:hypothetical protein
MSVIDGGVSQPGVQCYEEDVTVLFLDGTHPDMRVCTDCPPGDWPRTVTGRVLGLNYDEAVKRNFPRGGELAVVWRKKEYKFTLVSKEGHFEGGRDWDWDRKPGAQAPGAGK